VVVLSGATGEDDADKIGRQGGDDDGRDRDELPVKPTLVGGRNQNAENPLRQR